MVKDQHIIDLFKKRDGIKTMVELNDGKRISVWNIAWGYDMGDEFAHITSNISPNVENATIDFFYSRDIKKLFTA
jgi:hypothetical protein